MRQIPKLTGSDGKQFVITINDFRKGVMTLFDDTRLPLEAVSEANDMMLDQDGIWTVRPGTDTYGQALTTPIDGAGSFAKYNNDGTTDTYVWVIDNGSFKYAQNGGNWTTVSGKTWTTNKPVFGRQIRNRLYLANGFDTIGYYDITAGTLHSFTALSAPTTPTVNRTGLTSGSYNAYYKVTAVNEIGETLASPEGAVSGGINKTRDDWLAGTEYCTVTITRITGAKRYNIYYSDESGAQVYLDSVADAGSGATQNYIDYGTVVPNSYIETPAENTTSGPKYAYLSLSGNRLWGTKDPTQPYRVGWSGVGQYMGAFNPFYGGGYVDLNKGGSEVPEVVVHFRDGRGSSVATVLTSTPDGGGSTWHIALTTINEEVGAIVVPQAYQQQGSVGTRSPFGVVEYKNSVYFPSPKGFQSLGSQQQILNVLMTTEISANIRTSVSAINNNQAHKITGVAQNGRIYWSVPVGTTNNNQTWVYDVERRGAWSLYWGIGVKRFFEYTDLQGNIRLLAVPTTGNKLIAFNDTAGGDSGTPLNLNLNSGIIHWNNNHMTWARIDKVYVELAQPKGKITFTVSGTRKNKSFQSIGSITISDTLSNGGLGADLLGDFLLGDTNEAPQTYLQRSVKKRVRINKLLNNMRWQITSNTIDTKFKLIQVVIMGTLLPTSDPPSFKP